jgi:autotransporter-associated beta strand protein
MRAYAPAGALAAILLLLAAAPALPAPSVWDGGSTLNSNWTTAANWAGDVAPLTGNTVDIQIDGTLRLSPVVDTHDPWVLNSLTFSAAASSFSLSGYELSFEGTSAGTAVVNNSANTQKIANRLHFKGTGTKTIDAAAGSLTLDGNVGLDVTGRFQGSGDITVNGSVVGSGTLEKYGSGTLTLTQDNGYDGATTVGAGVLRIEHGQALGDTSAGTTVSSGASLHLAGGIHVGSEALALNGNGIAGEGAWRALSGDNLWNGTVTLASDSEIDVAASASLRIDGVIGESGGARALVKLGDGTLILNADNTFTGKTTVWGGVLQLGSSGRLNSSVELMVNSGAKFDLHGIATTVSRLTGTGQVALGSTGLTVNNAGACTFGGVISGTGGLTKTGSGDLTITGANTYGGDTLVKAGKLVVGAAGALGDKTRVRLQGATLELSDVDETIDALDGDAAGAVKLGTGTLTVGADNGDGTFSGTISGSGSLVKKGSGTQVLNAVQTYWGPTKVLAGRLRIDVTDCLGTYSEVIVDGGTFELKNVNHTLGKLSGSAGTVELGVGTLTVGNGNLISTFSGTIGGAGNLTKVGVGTFTLKGSNTYTGTTTLQGGYLALDAEDCLASASDVAITAGALKLLMTGTQTIASLSGTGGTVDLGSATLAIGYGNGNSDFSGDIKGSGSIKKLGTGTLRLSGDNTFTGGTHISSGVLKIDGAKALGDLSSTVTIESGAMLELSGDINIGAKPVTVSGSGAAGEGALRSISGKNEMGGKISLADNAAIACQANEMKMTGAPVAVEGAGKNLRLQAAEKATGRITGEVRLGSGELVKAGQGEWRMDARCEAGKISVEQGALRAGHGQALGGAGTERIVGSGGAIELDGGICIPSGKVRLSGSGVSTDAPGALRSVGGANEWAGEVVLDAAAIISAAAELLKVSGQVTGNGYELDLHAADGVTGKALGKISNAGGKMKKTGPGRWVLTAANDLAEAKVTEGTLAIAHADALGGAAAVSVEGKSCLEFSGGIKVEDKTLELNSEGTPDDGAAVRSSGGSNEWTGSIWLKAGATLLVQSEKLVLAAIDGLDKNLTLDAATGAVGTVGGKIGSGVQDVKKVGDGTWTLNHASEFAGDCWVAAGTLAINFATCLGSSEAGTYIEDKAGLDLAAGMTDIGESLGMVGLGPVHAGALVNSAGDNTVTGAVTLKGDSGIGVAAGTSLTLKGAVGEQGGPRQLTKLGTGTLALAANNTYTGKTLIENGTLKMAAGECISNKSDLQINSGTFDLQLYTETVDALDSSAAAKVLLGGGRLIVGADGGSGTYRGAMTGTGGLTKTGSGTETIDSDLAYSGATIVDGGTLLLNGQLTTSTPVQIKSGGTLQLGASDRLLDSATVSIESGGQLGLNTCSVSETIGALAGDGSVALGPAGTRLALGAGGGSGLFAGNISGLGDVEKTGAGTETFTSQNAYGGTTYVTAGTLRIEHAWALGSLGTGTTVSSGATLEVAESITVGEPLTLVNTGVSEGGALRSAGGSNTWNGAITLAGNAYIGVATGSDLTLTTAIGQSGGTWRMQKVGGGTLTLNAANGYTGPTVVVAGVLQIGASERLTDAADLAVHGTFKLQGYTETVNGLWGASTGQVDLGAGTLTVGFAGGGGSFAGTITGSGGFTKTGAGTQRLDGTSPYSGTTAVQNGTLELGGPLADSSPVSIAPGATLKLLTWGQLSDAADVTVTGTGIFDLNGVSATIDALAGSGSVTLGGAVLTVGADGGTATFSGAISGYGGLLKKGAGRQTLTSANAYDNLTTIHAGALRIQNASGLGAAAKGTVVVGGSLELENSPGLTVAGEALTLSGAGIAGSGALRNVAGNNSWTAAITLEDDATIGSDAGLLTLSGGITGAGKALTLTGAGNGDVTAAIAIGTGKVTKEGTGTWTLSASNSHTGGTAIYDGTLKLGPAGQIDDACYVSVYSPGVFDMAGSSDTIYVLAGSGTVVLGGATLTVAPSAPDTAWFSGTIGVAGSLAKAGTGLQVLAGPNTYTGATTIKAGVLQIAHNLALGTTAGGTTVAAGAALELADSITVTGESLTLNQAGPAGGGALRNARGDNTWAGTVALATHSTITAPFGQLTITGNVTGAGTDLTLAGDAQGEISGSIGTGAGNVIKNDVGTWALTGNNSYTGTTTINLGILNAGHPSALGSTAAGTVVKNGGALGLHNNTTITGEALTLNGLGLDYRGALQNLGGSNVWGSTLTLASSAGILSHAGDLTLTGAPAVTGAGTNLTLGGDSDGAATGAILLGGGWLGKTGAGTWTLKATYVGSVAVEAGTLVFDHPGINNLTGVTIGAPGKAGTFQTLQGTTNVSGSISGAGGSNLLAADGGRVTVQGNVTVDSLRVGFNGGTAATTVGPSVVVDIAGGTLDVARRTQGNGYTDGRLDLATAASVTTDIGTLRVGTVASGATQQVLGRLILSRSGPNTIGAGEIVVGDSATVDNTPVTSFVKLGQMDIFHTSALKIGGRQSVASADFMTGVAGTLSVIGPLGAPADLALGDNVMEYGGTGIGTLDLSGGTFNGTLANVLLGRHGCGPGCGQGILIMDAGNVTAQEVMMAWPNALFPNMSATPLATGGTITMRGGNFMIGSDVTMRSGTGILDIQGGTFKVGGHIRSVPDGSPGATLISLTGGVLDLSGGHIDFGADPSSSFTFTGGRLMNVGCFAATLNQGLIDQQIGPVGAGILAPGGSVGQTDITGDYNLLSGILEIEMQSPGLAPGTDYDLVQLSGASTTATLDATLKVILLGDYLPLYGDQFDVLTARNIVLGAGFALDQSEASLPFSRYFSAGVVSAPGGTALRLTVLPEPGTLVLLGLGTCLALLRGKRRTRRQS